MTEYEKQTEKWKLINSLDKSRRNANPFTKDETLPIINEKARMRGLSYGQYVNARIHGLYTEDAFKKIKLKYEYRVSFITHGKNK